MSMANFHIDTSNRKTTIAGIIQAIIVLLGVAAAALQGETITPEKIAMVVSTLYVLIGAWKAYQTADRQPTEPKP